MRRRVLIAVCQVALSLTLLAGAIARGENPPAADTGAATALPREAAPDAPARTQPTIARWYDLDDAASDALKAGKTDEARRAAGELLAGAAGRERNWNYGNAIHNGNIILGRIALDSGDVKKASEHLIAAGKSPGSPQLDSFGTDLTLAQDLLDEGEAKPVAEYLRLVSKFWEPMRPRLVAWATAIDNGLRPRLDQYASPDPRDDAPPPAENETVMSPGATITATTANGALTVTAGKGLERSYTWDGATRSVRMVGRKHRWHGGFGIFSPGAGEHWQDHNGITRGVLEEGRQSFDNVDAAVQWLRVRGQYLPYVWTDNGLAVGWTKVPTRKELNVEVWQVYVGGKKPGRMPGSQNDKIVVTPESPVTTQLEH